MISTTAGGAAKPWADRMCEWLTLAHVNLPLAKPAHGSVRIRTVIRTNSTSGASVNGRLPKGSADEITSLITSNLIPAVRKQLSSIDAKEPWPLAA